MTGLGLTRLALAGLVIAALDLNVPDIVPAPTWLGFFMQIAPALVVTVLVFVIALRVRQQRIAQKREKDWRQRRDLRSRGA